MKIMSISSWGEMVVLSEEGAVYKFHGLSPFQMDKVRKFIQRRQYGSAWKLLKKFKGSPPIRP